jgi:hypothetical protein
MGTTTQAARAARRASAKGGKGEDAGTITVKVDGEPYTLHLADLGPLDTLAVRKEAGMSLRQVLANAKDDPDIDIIAVIVWLARRHDGEAGLTLVKAAEGLTYSTDYEAADEPATDDVGEPGPEA